MALADNWESFIRIYCGDEGARYVFEKVIDELLREENPDKEVHRTNISTPVRTGGNYMWCASCSAGRRRKPFGWSTITILHEEGVITAVSVKKAIASSASRTSALFSKFPLDLFREWNIK